VGTAKNPTYHQGSAYLLIVSGCLFILGYAATWAPGVWILIGETFANRTRPRQGAMSTFANWVWNFLIAFFTTPIVKSIGFCYGYIFAGSNLAGAVFVYFFLYESSGLSLEAVDVMYNSPDVKPWTSGKWAPPGYASRYDFVKAKEANEGGADALMQEVTVVGSHSDDSTAAGGAPKKKQGVQEIEERGQNSTDV